MGADLEVAIHRGAMLQARGDYSEAVEVYRTAIAAAPARAALHYNLGASLRSAGRLGEAEVSFRKALGLGRTDPQIRLAVGSALLSLGAYSDGWPLHEARYDVPGLNQPKPSVPFPEWDGTPLRGKTVAIFPEQGFGDQIQFCRFVRDLREADNRVVMLCRPGLERLLADNLDAEVLAADGSVEFPDPDVWTTITSLPAKLSVTLEQLDGAAYLRAGPGNTTRGGSPRIGLAWQGNPHHRNDSNRSLPSSAADALKAIIGDWVSLDPADSGAGDFADTAALINELDLVISVDTSVAHLAGALGKPCWVLLPAVNTDWRWLRERRDSPWYGSVRLYRQQRPGDWSAVIAEIEQDLRARFA